MRLPKIVPFALVALATGCSSSGADPTTGDEQDLTETCEARAPEAQRVGNPGGDTENVATTWTSCLSGASTTEILGRLEALALDDATIGKSKAFAEYHASKGEGDLVSAQGLTRDVKIRFDVGGVDSYVSMRVTTQKDAKGNLFVHAVNTSSLAKKLLGVTFHEIVPTGGIVFDLMASPAKNGVRLRAKFSGNDVDLLFLKPLFDKPENVATSISTWVEERMKEQPR